MATNKTTDSTFQDDISSQSNLVLVDFWAEWCGPCKMLMPTIDKIANDFNGKVVVGKVNVDNERDIAAKYNVRGIPNLLVFSAGEPQEQLVGNVPENQITDILNKFI